MAAVWKRLQGGRWGVKAHYPVMPGDRIWVLRSTGTWALVTIDTVTKGKFYWFCSVKVESRKRRTKKTQEGTLDLRTADGRWLQ